MTADGLEIIQPSDWPAPRGYSNAIRVPAGQDLLFLAGQIGWDATGKLAGPDLTRQFRQALANVVRLVEAAGGRPTDIVRLTMFCKDKRDYLGEQAPIGAAYREIMGRHFPCMSLVEVANLVETGALIEIEATAALPAAVDRGPR